ncbi:MAG: PQQ-binding-like beta-propeller repeat protein [bacterium]|nr:PQQ-binding-like beta-propeller repeat protein [bacterium]
MRLPNTIVGLLLCICTFAPACRTSVPGGGTSADPPGADVVTDPEDEPGDATTDGAGAVEVAAGEVYVDLYDADRTCEGTTYLPDLHDPANPRIIEVDMQGNVVWEYVIPDHLKEYRDPGMDVEVLSDERILFVLPRHGIYEIERDVTVVWSHLDDRISHDADRLPDGNTIYVWGGPDQKDDAQVKEVTPEGELVWSWYAKDWFDEAPYADVYRDGWTHTNAVTRLPSGNTVISLRNFNLTVEVDREGEPVWSYDWSTLGGDDPHEPETLPDDHLLICLQHVTPHQVVEIDRATGEVVWEYYLDGLRTARDSDRLPNGNTLIQAVLSEGDDSIIFEVTPEGETVWQLKLQDTPATSSPGWFYKAQRACPE